MPAEIVSYGIVICLQDWFFVDFRGKFRVFRPETGTIQLKKVQVIAVNVRV